MTEIAPTTNPDPLSPEEAKAKAAITRRSPDEELKTRTSSWLELPRIEKTNKPSMSSQTQKPECIMNSLPTIPLFPFGQILATTGALALLEDAQRSPTEFLSRHLRGDWGDLCEEDRAENEMSLKHDFRLLSNYAVTGTAKLWIITEADRSVTTLLLPEEY